MPSPKKKLRKSKVKKSKPTKKRHSRYVKSFIRKDGVYIKGHYRVVGGKRT
jgi:hypothetical protein